MALVHWIRGVAVATIIVFPAASRMPNASDAIAAFEQFERRFAAQVRISIALVGASYLYMLHVFDAWDRFEFLSFWWLHLMVAALVLFAVMVYVVEPLFLRCVFRELALRDKNWVFTIAIRVHAVALAVSAIAIGAGVLGAHGGL